MYPGARKYNCIYSFVLAVSTWHGITESLCTDIRQKSLIRKTCQWVILNEFYLYYSLTIFFIIEFMALILIYSPVPVVVDLGTLTRG